MKKELIDIVQLFVFTNHEAKNGITVKTVQLAKVIKSEKSYSGTDLRLSINKFETPLPRLIKTDTTPIGYYIWTTPNNHANAILKCVECIITDFERRDKFWNLTSKAIQKAKKTIKH